MKPTYGQPKTGRFSAIIAVALFVFCGIVAAQLPQVLLNSQPSGRTRSAVRANVDDGATSATVQVRRLYWGLGDESIEQPSIGHFDAYYTTDSTTLGRWKHRNITRAAQVNDVYLDEWTALNDSSTTPSAERVFWTLERTIESTTDGAETGGWAFGALKGGTFTRRLEMNNGLLYVRDVIFAIEGIRDNTATENGVAYANVAGVLGYAADATAVYAGKPYMPLVMKNGSAPKTDVRYAGYTLDVRYDDVGNVTTGVDTLQTLAIPGHTFSVATSGLHLRMSFTLAANANSKQIIASFGGSTFYDSTAQVHNGGDLVVDSYLTRGSATTVVRCDTKTANSAATPLFRTAQFASLTEDTEAAQTLLITGEAIATNDIVFHGWRLDYEAP